MRVALALAAELRQMAGRDVVIALDDVHKLDDDDHRRLLDLRTTAPEGVRIRAAFTSSPTSSTRHLDLAKNGALVVELSGLGPEEVAEWSGRAGVSPDHLDQVMRVTNGVPFHVRDAFALLQRTPARGLAGLADDDVIRVRTREAWSALFDPRKRATTRTPKAGRHYVLAGLVHCGLCGRRMQGHWNHGRAYYRCKFTEEYPGGDPDHPRNVYVKEEAITPGLDAWLGSLFDDEHLDDTCAALAGASEPDPEAEKREADLRAAIADCDRRIGNYRALLDDEDTVTLAAGWIAEVQRERKGLERQLRRHVPGGELTADEVKALVRALRDIVSVLAEAEPVDKSELYDQLGISLHYDPAGSVSVQSHPRGVQVGVGGPISPLPPRAIPRSAALLL